MSAHLADFQANAKNRFTLPFLWSCDIRYFGIRSATPSGTRSAVGAPRSLAVASGAMEESPYSETMQKDLVKQIEQEKPAYVVFVNSNLSWLVRPSSIRYIFQWIHSNLKTTYTEAAFVAPLNMSDIHPTVQEARPPSGDSPVFVTIFKRTAAADR